jgi:hypothetical protein
MKDVRDSEVTKEAMYPYSIRIANNSPINRNARISNAATIHIQNHIGASKGIPSHKLRYGFLMMMKKAILQQMSILSYAQFQRIERNQFIINTNRISCPPNPPYHCNKQKQSGATKTKTQPSTHCISMEELLIRKTNGLPDGLDEIAIS